MKKIMLFVMLGFFLLIPLASAGFQNNDIRIKNWLPVPNPIPGPDPQPDPIQTTSSSGGGGGSSISFIDWNRIYIECYEEIGIEVREDLMNNEKKALFSFLKPSNWICSPDLWRLTRSYYVN